MRFLAAAALVLILAALMAPPLTDFFLYYPMRHPAGAWDLQVAVGAQDRWLTAADGTRLHGWWFPAADSGVATLFLHGNAGNVTHRTAHARAVNTAGSAFLVIDYRGYGKSNGRPSERGLYADAEAGYTELGRLGYAPRRIVIHGESLGSAIAVELATRRPAAGLVLETPFRSVRRMASHVMPLVGPLLARGFDTESRIGNLRAPLLIIHGDQDEIVPFGHGESLFRLANEPKQFWRVSGAGHNDLLETAGVEYVERLRSFYAGLK